MVRSLRHTTAIPITTRNLEVIRAEDITSGMRRVTLGGEQLAAHVAENDFPSERSSRTASTTSSRFF